MKGEFPEEIIMTSLQILAVAVIIIIALITLVLTFGFSGTSPMSNSIDFVVQTNKPYALAAALTQLRSGDRNFLEHAIEISYSSVQNASSYGLGADVQRIFSDEYELRLQSVYITEGGRKLFDVSHDGAPITACGDEFDGFCVRLLESVTYKYGGCGVGRVEIPEGRNQCSSSPSVCCKFDKGEFERRNTDVDVFRCGPDFEGVCNPYNDFEAESSTYYIATCGEGVRHVDGNTCSQYNSGNTPVCCIYGAAARQARAADRINHAEIPLIYRGVVGKANIDIG